MEIILSTLPVLLFLTFLFLLDSFKLVVYKLLILSVLWGMSSALIAYILNTFVTEQTHFTFDFLSKYLAPAIEECLKALLIFFLIRKKRIGFMIDAAIYGFAIGTGFALVENIFYWTTSDESSLLIWIIRGFGTALMHGGCTALLALIWLGGLSRQVKPVLNISLAFILSYIIHSAFNHFYINPIFQTLGIIVILPATFILIFKYNENQLQSWLEIEFNSEIELLNTIRKGQFTTTRAGEYLRSLKSRFSPETILDMYCFIQTYLDLSIKAKRNLMLKESGFPIILEDDIQDKLKELEQLKKQIGKIGELTLAPLIRMNYRDLWKLNTLKQ